MRSPLTWSFPFHENISTAPSHSPPPPHKSTTINSINSINFIIILKNHHKFKVSEEGVVDDFIGVLVGYLPFLQAYPLHILFKDHLSHHSFNLNHPTSARRNPSFSAIKLSLSGWAALIMVWRGPASKWSSARVWFWHWCKTTPPLPLTNPHNWPRSRGERKAMSNLNFTTISYSTPASSTSFIPSQNLSWVMATWKDWVNRQFLKWPPALLQLVSPCLDLWRRFNNGLEAGEEDANSIMWGIDGYRMIFLRGGLVSSDIA